MRAQRLVDREQGVRQVFMDGVRRNAWGRLGHHQPAMPSRLAMPVRLAMPRMRRSPAGRKHKRCHQQDGSQPAAQGDEATKLHG